MCDCGPGARSHGRGTPCNRRTQIMEHIVVNGSVHTAFTQHQRICNAQTCLPCCLNWALWLSEQCAICFGDCIAMGFWSQACEPEYLHATSSLFDTRDTCRHWFPRDALFPLSLSLYVAAGHLSCSVQMKQLCEAKPNSHFLLGYACGSLGKHSSHCPVALFCSRTFLMQLSAKATGLIANSSAGCISDRDGGASALTPKAPARIKNVSAILAHLGDWKHITKPLKGYPHWRRIGIRPELSKRIAIEMNSNPLRCGWALSVS